MIHWCDIKDNKLCSVANCVVHESDLLSCLSEALSHQAQSLWVGPSSDCMHGTEVLLVVQHVMVHDQLGMVGNLLDYGVQRVQTLHGNHVKKMVEHRRWWNIAS